MNRRRPVYSLLRWSTPDQRFGRSEQRQLQRGADYAAEQGWEFVQNIVCQGSAFRGRNFVDGPLAEFVAAVRRGDIPRDAVLMVESLDRISRDHAADADLEFKQILRLGIEIVTLIKPIKHYTWQILRENPLAMLEVIFVFMRSHEESATKSHRNTDVWTERRKKMMEGGDPLTSKTHGWLAVKTIRGQRRLVVDPSRGNVVRTAWVMRAQGAGLEQIVHKLNEAGVACFGNGKRVSPYWRKPQIRAMLTTKAVIGVMQVGRVVWQENQYGERVKTREILGEKEAACEAIFDLTNDADRIIYERVTALNTRAAPFIKRDGKISTLLAGLVMCGSCGGSMTRQVKGKKHKPQYICSAAHHRAGTCRRDTVPVEDVETLLIDHIDVLDRERPTSDELDEKTAALYEKFQSTSAKLDEMMAISRSGKPVAQGFLEHMVEVSVEMERLRLESRDQMARSRAVQNASFTELAAVLGEYPREPQKINALLRSIFDRIVIDAPGRHMQIVWKTDHTSSLSF